MSGPFRQIYFLTRSMVKNQVNIECSLLLGEHFKLLPYVDGDQVQFREALRDSYHSMPCRLSLLTLLSYHVSLTWPYNCIYSHEISSQHTNQEINLASRTFSRRGKCTTEPAVLVIMQLRKKKVACGRHPLMCLYNCIT